MPAEFILNRMVYGKLSYTLFLKGMLAKEVKEK